MPVLSVDTPKERGIEALALALGVAGFDCWNGEFAALFDRTYASGKPRNPNFVFRKSDDIPGVVRHLRVPRGCHVLPTPDLIGRTRPEPYRGGQHETPPLDLLELPNGAVFRLAGAPIVVAADGRTVAEDLSSVYARLLHSYDADLCERLAHARHVRGTALVVMSDIGDGNYCHWMFDELPRLALVRNRPDVTILISAAAGPWRRETLRLLGVPDERVVEVGPHEAVRADALLVPSCTQNMQHPAHKGAGWAVEFIRSSIGVPAMARLPAPEPETRYATRLYVGRGDSPSRRLLNEADLLRVLEPAGFVSVTMGGRSVPEQVALFAHAKVVVALHGAALTNIVFCEPRTRLVEIFTPGRGTSAYGIVAGALGMPYAEILADPGSNADLGLQDCRLDVAEFWRVVEPWLRQSVFP